MATQANAVNVRKGYALVVLDSAGVRLAARKCVAYAVLDDGTIQSRRCSVVAPISRGMSAPEISGMALPL